MSKRPGKRERIKSKQAKATRRAIIEKNLSSPYPHDLPRTDIRTNASQLARVESMAPLITNARGLRSPKKHRALSTGFEFNPTPRKVTIEVSNSYQPEHRRNYKRFSSK